MAFKVPFIKLENTQASILREYISNDTWTKPDGLKELIVVCVGAGGGGGSGRNGANNVAKYGGGGGRGGSMVVDIIQASDLSSSISITVGSGGSGGAAITSPDTNGLAGTAGGDTSFGSFVIAKGGGGGQGGTSTAYGAGGSLQSGDTPSWVPNRLIGAPSAGDSALGRNGLDGQYATPSSGRSYSTNGTATNAHRAGGGVYDGLTLISNDTNAGTDGQNHVGKNIHFMLEETGSYGIGTAGNGGGDGLKGGNGGNCGATGAGGGSNNLFNNNGGSGAGGNGGDGLVKLVEIYY